MKKVLSILLALTALCSLNAQSYSDDFDNAFAANDIDAQRAALQRWQQSSPHDVDLCIARYNFYVNQAIVSLGHVEGEGESDTAWVTVDFGNTVADFSFLNQELADSALLVIRDGIQRFPNRLDLRFGEIYFLGQIGRWDDFVDRIIATLDHSEQIEHFWSFPNITEGFASLISESMQDYQVDMYNAITDFDHPTSADTAMFLRMRRVAKRTVQLFPAEITAINMLAVTHTFTGDYEQAIKYLQRAEKIDPADPIVIQNLADNYKLLGNKKLYQQYLRKLEKLNEQQ